MTWETLKDQHVDEDDDVWWWWSEASGWGGRPRLFLNITTEDVDDCCDVMWWETDGAFTHAKRTRRRSTQCLQPALNVTLQHGYKNICTCAYTYVHICIFTCIIYRDAFCHVLLKVFIKYLLKKNKQTNKTHPLLSPGVPLKPVSLPLLFPANGQAALNVGRILWWYYLVFFVLFFLSVFTLHSGHDTSLAPPIAL